VIYDGYSHVSYALGAGSCHGERGLARSLEARARLADWNAGKHGRETAMPLLIARHTRCMAHDEDDSDGNDDPDDSTAYPVGMPPTADLIHAIGTPNDRTAEDAFVLGMLGYFESYCLGFADGESLALRAEAVRKDPSNALYRYFLRSGNERRGSVDAMAAEVHRQFDHRGEHYRTIRDQLREELTIYTTLPP
jgi:hypothetical protein